uniref:Mitochondrial 2-oxodicarboxylate carrier n=1 Tax=Ditylenchus dipsaci TaxID=166011 RepID=A0A915EM02_9BILA
MEKLKDGGRQFVAGGSAGLVEICIMHPLDLIKTRLQIGGGHFNGYLPPILAETPKRATKFLTFAQYTKILESFGDALPAWSRHPLAGLFSGLTEAIVVCPFEVVKVRLQSEHNVVLKEQKSTAAVAREIIKTKGLGLNGLYLGLGSTFYRHGVWNMVYFGIYHNLRSFYTYSPPKTASTKWNFGDVAIRLFMGFVAGTLASITNIPFDVAKSRIQGPQPQVVVFITTLGKPLVMRLGPGGGIMLVVYESVYDFLAKNT